MAKSTTYVVDYLEATVTIYTDDRSFVDFPNKTEVRKRIDDRYQNTPNRTRVELRSDPDRYRVYYPKNSLGALFTDIEAIMKKED